MKKTQSEIEELSAEKYPIITKELFYIGGSETVESDPSQLREGFIAGYTACQEEDRSIPVSERLPNENGFYLVWFDYSDKPEIRMFSIDLQFLDVHITHWQPLPNPPKK